MSEPGKKIMLVDDEVDFLNIMSKFFSRRKLDIQVADCCLKALEWLDKDSFDVVVIDVKMPGLDGLECMLQMKKIQPDLEFIILTGHSSITSGLEGIKKGAFDYCLKPVNFEEILEMILLARRKIAENS
jgi:DNA-binding NtrC family response regulator